MYARPGAEMLNRKVTLTRLMFGCMLGWAPKCLTARWSPKDVYFRNAMRVKPSPRTGCWPSRKKVFETRLTSGESQDIQPGTSHEDTRFHKHPLETQVVSRHIKISHSPMSTLDFASTNSRRSVPQAPVRVKSSHSPCRRSIPLAPAPDAHQWHQSTSILPPVYSQNVSTR